MRMVVALVLGLLSVAVVLEGAALVRARARVAALDDRVRALESARAEATTPARAPLVPPRFVAPPANDGDDDHAPSDDKAARAAGTLATPDGRALVEKAVAEELERAHAGDQARTRAQREEIAARLRESQTTALGLSAPDAHRMQEILAAGDHARDDLFAKTEAPNADAIDFGREMAAIRTRTDRELRSFLGDDRWKQYEDLQPARATRALLGAPAMRPRVVPTPP